LIHHVEVQVLILLLIASLVGMLARRLRLPYTLALVLAGLGLSVAQIGALSDLALTPELLLLLFLPPLLFEAAYHLPFEDLRRNGPHIAFLGVLGVLVSAGLTALGTFFTFGRLGLVDGFGWTHALLFAAVISATDPISVLALFKEIGVPQRLYQIVEGEALINDGVAVVVFAILSAVFGLPSGHANAASLHGAGELVSFGVAHSELLAKGSHHDSSRYRRENAGHRWLGMTRDSSTAHRQYDLARGRALAYREVIREGEKQLSRGMIDELMYRRVIASYQQAREQARSAARDYEGTSPEPRQMLEAARALALIEREELENVVKAGLMAADTCGELLAELDSRLESLEGAASESDEALQVALARLYPTALEHRQ
jgi:sodium/hydrogen exchanger family protein